MDTELIRKAYKPSIVRLLLVGESPPASGGFFYLKDRKVLMTTYTAHAFEKAHGITFPSNEEFFDYFRFNGCYLDDLCHFPVDKLSTGEREQCLKASIDSLAHRVREMNPAAVAAVLKKIEWYVREAIRKSGRDPEVFVLPFPGNGHQAKYIEQLSRIIQSRVPSS